MHRDFLLYLATKSDNLVSLNILNSRSKDKLILVEVLLLFMLLCYPQSVIDFSTPVCCTHQRTPMRPTKRRSVVSLIVDDHSIENIVPICPRVSINNVHTLVKGRFFGARVQHRERGFVDLLPLLSLPSNAQILPAVDVHMD